MLRGSKEVSSSTVVHDRSDPHAGHPGSNAPTSSARGRPRSRPDLTARWAAVRAFTVDDHAAGQDEAAGEADSSQLLKQYGGGKVVVANVIRHVVETQSKTDPCGLMADGIDSVEHVDPLIRVDEVGLHERRRRVGMARSDPVDHHDVVSLLDQEVDDVRPDEARTARHEHVHARNPWRVTGVRNTRLIMTTDGICRRSAGPVDRREVSDS